MCEDGSRQGASSRDGEKGDLHRCDEPPLWYSSLIGSAGPWRGPRSAGVTVQLEHAPAGVAPAGGTDQAGLSGLIAMSSLLHRCIAMQCNEVQCSPIPVDAMMQRCNEALHAGVQSWRREVSAAESAPPGGSRYLRPGFSTGSCSALLLLNLN